MNTDREDGPIPGGQTIYDRMFLWLILGLIVPGTIFTLWGLIDILMLTPPAAVLVH